MPRTTFGKTRDINAPYAIYRAPGDAMEWRILKTYKHGANEDDFSRWFIAAKSDATFGSFELGDTYARDVLNYGLLVAATPEWLEQYRQKSTIHPDHRVTALD